jgi:hypothetical protein
MLLLHSQIRRSFSYKNILRGGAEVARWAHNPKAVGSNPAPAILLKASVLRWLFY